MAADPANPPGPARRPVYRVGSGLDVHALRDGLPLWLAGVQVEHPRGLAGHSDGDAALHALVDALLGAAALGDIGQWFPSSDARWRAAPSRVFVEEVWSRLRGDGWWLENVDLTIVASQPRLTPYREAMRASIAAMLGVGPEAVSVKATTTDGLGALGRAEGVLALATVLLWRE